MGNMKRRMAALATAVALAASSLVGCGATALDHKATVMTVGEEKVPVGVANFYARYQQAMAEASYSSYFGEDFWSMDMDGKGTTMEDSVKGAVLKDLKRMYVSEEQMKEYNVSLTDADKKAISEATEKFLKANKAEDLEMISGDEATVNRVFELLTIQKKVHDAIIADVDTNVSDEEAAQKAMQYVFFSFTKSGGDSKSATMTDDEKKELKAKAEKFISEVKEKEDFKKFAEEQKYTVLDATFDADKTTLDATLIKEADQLKEGEVSKLIETEQGYYVAKLTSDFDKAATEVEKGNIVKTRQDKKYTEVSDKMIKDAKIDVNKNEWKKVNFQTQKVQMKQAEKK